MTAAIALLQRAWPYLLGVFIAVAALFWAYRHGVATEGMRWQARYNADIAAANQAKADALEHARAIENKAAADQAAIEYNLLGRLNDAQNTADRTIADLRSGTIRMRDDFASAICTAASVSGIATSTAQRDAACNRGLRTDHAEFLIRFAQRAKATAEQLRAAQQVIVNDRRVCGSQDDTAQNVVK